MRSVTLVAFRHGETDWNVQKRLQGHTDIPLNLTGVTQAKVLSEKLKEIKFHKILSSDLSRAFHTAQLVNQFHNVEIVNASDLRECQLGSAEGLLRSELEGKFGQLHIEKWLSSKKEHRDFRFENGESKAEHSERMKKLIESQIQQLFAHEAQTNEFTLGVSTHGGSVRRLLELCSNFELEEFTTPNCSAFKISIQIQSELDFVWLFENRIC
jgi:probable phosphoglycerate mutase